MSAGSFSRTAAGNRAYFHLSWTPTFEGRLVQLCHDYGVFICKLGWNINYKFLFYATKNATFWIHNVKKIINNKPAKSVRLIFSPIQINWWIFTAWAAKCFSFQVQVWAKGEWNNFRLAKSKSQLRARQSSAIFVLLFCHSWRKCVGKKKAEQFFDNLVITYSPKGNTEENRLPCLAPISLNEDRHKPLSFRQCLNKRAFYVAYWK